MKNLHVLTTDKPNFGKYLVLNKEGKLCIWNTNTMGSQKTLSTQHIYITSDEEIKEGDYGLDIFHKEVRKFRNKNFQTIYDKKIILTTDQDLIKDGVQIIDDEFLEWFVKNPSCDKVEVVKDRVFRLDDFNQREFYNRYKIIIPNEEPNYNMKYEIEWLSNNPQCKQIESCSKSLSKKCICIKKEPKQETLEEAAENYSQGWGENDDKKSFINGTKWQAERMYSEEDMIEFHKWAFQKNRIEESDKTTKELLLEWFEQSKKKQ